MKIISFAETRNQIVHLGRLMPGLRAAGHVLTLMLPLSLKANRLDEEARIQDIPYVDIDKTVAADLQSKGRGLSQDAVLRLRSESRAPFARQTLDGAGLFLTLNDGTSHSKPLGALARAMGIKTMTIQDGMHGFEAQPEIIPDWYPEAERRALETGHVPPEVREFARTHIHPNQCIGGSVPDRSLVWGQAAADIMRLLHGVPADSIRVVGSLTANPVLFEARHCPRPNPDRLNIFYADQNLVHQRKMKREDWMREFPRFMNVLARFEPMFKFHPGETEEIRSLVTGAFGDHLRLLTQPLVNAALFDEVDVMVALTSSTFLTALECGKPVIIYRMPKMANRFPDIRWPLLRVVDTIPDLLSVLIDFERTGEFQGNTHGRDLSHYIAPGDAVGAVLEEVDRIARAVRC